MWRATSTPNFAAVDSQLPGRATIGPKSTRKLCGVDSQTKWRATRVTVLDAVFSRR